MLDLRQVNGGGWYIFLGIVIEEFGSCSALFFIDLYASVFCFLFFVFFLFFFSATMYKKHGHAQIQLPETDVVFYSL